METFYRLFTGIVLTTYFIGFITKNILTAKRTKQSIKGKSAKVTFLIFASTLLYTITYLHLFKKPAYLIWISILDMPFLRNTGTILMSIAFVLGFISLITMKDSWRVGIKPEQNTELIMNGVFRFSRNPYFLSYILMFAGIFLIFPTLIYLIIYILFVIIIHLMIIDEEKYLTEKHGDSYLKYKNSVCRYINLKIRNRI
jgi:protein-S-isoprenylcysteine O-methyltransferase Ste14